MFSKLQKNMLLLSQSRSQRLFIDCSEEHHKTGAKSYPPR